MGLKSFYEEFLDLCKKLCYVLGTRIAPFYSQIKFIFGTLNIYFRLSEKKGYDFSDCIIVRKVNKKNLHIERFNFFRYRQTKRRDRWTEMKKKKTVETGREEKGGK